MTAKTPDPEQLKARLEWLEQRAGPVRLHRVECQCERCQIAELLKVPHGEG